MDLSLTESESRYYNDLFSLCDVDKSGKFCPFLKSVEFFRSSSIDDSILSQVSTVINCDAAAEARSGGALSHRDCRKTQLTWEGHNNFFSLDLFEKLWLRLKREHLNSFA